MLKQTLSLAMLAIAFCLTPSVSAQEPARNLPLSSSNSPSDNNYQGPSVVQQRAMFAAEQRMLRLEYYNWIGYSPLRPTMNGSYMSNGVQRFYIPSRGVIVSSGSSRGRYW